MLDLRGATFIDSTITSVLLAANRRSDEAGQPLAIVLSAATTPVRRIFEVTRLLTVFRVFDDPDVAVDAVARLAQPA